MSNNSRVIRNSIIGKNIQANGARIGDVYRDETPHEIHNAIIGNDIQADAAQIGDVWDEPECKHKPVLYKYIADSKVRGSLSLKDFVESLTNDEMLELLSPDALVSPKQGFAFHRVMLKFLGEEQSFKQCMTHFGRFRRELQAAISGCLWAEYDRETLLKREFVCYTNHDSNTQ